MLTRKNPSAPQPASQHLAAPLLLGLHSTPTAPALAALAAGLWRGLSASGDAGRADLTTQASLASGGKRPPGMARRVSADLLSSQDLGSQGGGGAEGGWPGGDGDGAAGHSLLLMGASTDGQVWQWQVPLLAGTLAGPKAKELPPPPKPELLGERHGGTHALLPAACSLVAVPHCRQLSSSQPGSLNPSGPSQACCTACRNA